MPLLITLALLSCISFPAECMTSDTLWNQTDGQGMKQGFWKKEYPGGGPVYEGFFRNDRPVGMMQRFYENGKKQADLNYIGGADDVYAKLYYQNGKTAAIGKYVGMQKDSTWLYYSYYTSALSYLENYRKGEKHGPSVKYYPEGPVAETMMWEHGKKNGEWQQFYEDSTLRLSASYLEGKLNGPYFVYNRDKFPVIQGNYRDGKMDGVWNFNNNEGKLENQLEYDNGKILNREDLERWVEEYMKEVEENLGKIPEVDFDNYFDRL